MRISIGLAGLFLAMSARAETHSYSVVIPAAPTNWNAVATVPKWDPSNGTLEFITLTLTPTAEGTLALENAGATPVLSHATFAAAVTVTFPDLTVLVWPTPSANFDDTLGPFDGTLDFGGPSGVTHSGISATDSVTTTYPPPPTYLVVFTGPPGNPGTIDLPVSAVDTSSWSNGLVAQVTQTVRATIALTYHFTPHPITAFCFGDGSGTACPCGNSGGAGRGCASSLDPMGARLSWSGSPSVSDDTLVLHGAGTGVAPILYFQATLQWNGGLGSWFGDGLRCTGGTIMRLGTQSSSAGLSQYPSGAQPRISIQGGIPATGSVTRYYQALYRNNAAFCTPSTFNLTNAVLAPWFV